MATNLLDLEQLSTYFGEWYKDQKEVAKASMSSDLYPYTELFSPIEINELVIKNRVVMAPMGNINMAEETGRPSEMMVRFFEERAKGGVGLITTGLVPVAQGIDPSLLEKGNLSYFPRLSGSRTFISGWREIADACHAYGSRFFIQLSAGLGRVGNPECLTKKKRFPRSASFNLNYYVPQVPSLRLTDWSLKRIVKAMGQAAADAKASKADGVYLHAHEGYLMEQLANTAYNRRKIGRYKDPQRFGLDIVEEIRRRVGPDYPILFRINLSLALQATYGEKMKSDKVLKHFVNERQVDETLEYMGALVKSGVDAFDVDLGSYENWWLPHPPMYMPPATYVPVALAVKEYFKQNEVLSNKGKEIPVIAVGKLGYPDLAEKTLREGKADMIMLGRPLLADPAWPKKAYAGRVPSIRPCIGCQEACVNEFVKGGRPHCTVNPRCSFEGVFPELAPLARTLKRIAVVGAGPAGMEAALTLHERGHAVWLYDEQELPGGKLNHVAHIPNKKDLANLLEWYRNRIEMALHSPNFHYLPGTIASVSVLEDERYDAIICATGASDKRTVIPGGEIAVSASEVADNPELASGKKNIVIIGGGLVGTELAFLLADEEERQVTIVEKLPYLMQWECTANRGYLLHYLEEKDVNIYNCSSVLSIHDGHVVVRKNNAEEKPDPWNTWTPVLPENVVNPFSKEIPETHEEVEVPCDLCILAVGSESRTALYDELVKNYCAPEVLKIGDAFSSEGIKEAIHSGYRLGLML